MDFILNHYDTAVICFVCNQVVGRLNLDAGAIALERVPSGRCVR